ncbi:MAG: DUF4097 family beta strand repeat protein [Treponema sp.]|nr:DUF4097 family beta strand repeat protein [Treponema sp.]
MTRDEYLTALKNNIQSLTIDEQNEALQYYSDYFDDANDDEKVMEELGTPEEVAALIREKCSNSLVKNEKAGDDKSESAGSDSTSGGRYEALYYEFKNTDVKGIEFSFGAAEVVLIQGKKFSVETRGISKQNLLCRVDGAKTLVVKNLNKLSGLNFFNHDRPSRIVPRILISIPEDAKLNTFRAAIGAGNFVAKDISVSFEKGKIEVGAGNFVLKKLDAANLDLRCGMGNLHIEGAIKGTSNIDCGMGAIKLELSGNENDYSYDAKVGLGDFKFNNEKRSGVCQVYANTRKENHFSVNCGMGSVNIKMN